MPLPIVNGWLIDYRTARDIFASGDNILINACVGLCQSGDMKYCHCEHKDFQKDDLVKPTFVEEQLCRLEPDGDTMQRCAALTSSNHGKPFLNGDASTIFLIGLALSFQYGILSDSNNNLFLTVTDLGPPLGIHVLTTAQFRHNL